MSSQQQEVLIGIQAANYLVGTFISLVEDQHHNFFLAVASLTAIVYDYGVFSVPFQRGVLTFTSSVLTFTKEVEYIWVSTQCFFLKVTCSRQQP